MEDSEILLSYLYVNPPPGVPRNKVDGAFADYKIALDRGDEATFGEILVRRGILRRGEPEKILAAEKAAYDKSSVKGPKGTKEKKASPPRPPSDRKPAKEPLPKVPSGSRTKKIAPPKPRTDWKKIAAPALLALLLVGAIVWRAAPKPPVEQPVAVLPKPAQTIDWLAPAKKGGEVKDWQPGTDPLLDKIRELIDEATVKDPDAAEKALDEAIQKAKTPEEKERLEQVRWRIKLIRKQRKAAATALDEARKLAAQGKNEEAAEKLAGAQAPTDSPEGRALDAAKQGKGEWRRELEPGGSKAGSDAAAPPRPRRKPGEKRRPVPVPRAEEPLPLPAPGDSDRLAGPSGPGAAPPTPPDSDDEGEGPLPGGDLVLAKKTEGRRKHGQRPRGEARDGGLVVSFLDDVDEDPEDDDAETPEQVRAAVAPIELATPKEVEPERADAIARLASDGLVYLEQVKAWLAEQRAYRDGCLGREAARVREATSDTARFLKRIEVPGGLVLQDATVSQYDASGFALKDSHATWGSSWANNSDLGIEVRKLAVDPNEPRDLLRLGRWCARMRAFTHAKGAFRKAVGLDPSLASRIPDVDQLEQESKVFTGQLVRLSDSIKVSWRFGSPRELEDFDARGAVTPLKDALLLDGDDAMALAQLARPIIFAGSVSFDARIQPRAGIAIAGFMVKSTDEESAGTVHTFQVRYDGVGGRAFLIDTALQTPLAMGDAGPNARTIHLELAHDALEARVGAFNVRVPFLVAPSWETVPYVGSLGGRVVVEQLVLGGHPHPDWLRKTLGGADFKMALRLEDSIGAPSFAYLHAAPQLSAEVSYIASGVTPAVLHYYERAQINVKTATPAAYLAALGELRYVTDEAPDFAPAQYLLAQCALVFGRRGFALECLNEAVKGAGGFAEAVALRAKVLVKLRRFADAEKDVKKALEWRADLPLAHAVASELDLAQQELALARSELELSFALDPHETSVETRLALVGHAVQGPPWERASVVETDHYTWRSSLKKDRVAQVAGLLEMMRPIYESTLGMRPQDEKRKSAVLLFDSVPSFQDYNQIAIRSGIHPAANGVFFPLTKELELCDTIDDPTGMKTCAVAFHEGFHQFLDRIIECDTIPFWVNEGLGEYFGGSVLDAGVLRPGQIQRGRLGDLLRLGPIPLDDLMNDEGPNFMAHAFQRYAQSWSVVQYLMEGERGRWKPLLIAYLEHLRAGRSPPNSYNRTFGRIDMDELERGWREHVLEMARRVR